MINGKAIYTTKGAAWEYGRVGCNFYTGCSNNCEYCYLKRGAPSKLLGGTEVQLKKCFKNEDDAIDVFCKEVRKHIDTLRETGVFFSFTTDPLIHETCDLTLSAIYICINNGIPVKVLTKDACFLNYTRFGASMLSDGFKNLVSIGFTLTGHDEMEPKASTNYERIQAMQLLHGAGVRTFASIEPVIDWTHTNIVVQSSLDCCDHYNIGLRSGVRKDYYDLVGSGLWIENLVRDITAAGRTVYLKESARNLLARCYKTEKYNEIMSRTVDMEGNNWKTI